MNVPPFAESVTEGDLRWVKGVGDQVLEDETVAEVETDKVNNVNIIHFYITWPGRQKA